MSSWVLIALGTVLISMLVFVVRRWGQASAERKVLKGTIAAVKTRKEIDRETQNLSPTELADLLRRGL